VPQRQARPHDPAADVARAADDQDPALGRLHGSMAREDRRRMRTSGREKYSELACSSY
jgi:hypothetical protein